MTMKKFLAVPLVAAVLALGSFGPASAQTAAPRVGLEFANTGLTTPLVASSSDAVIARLIMDTTGSTEAVRIVSVPLNVTAGGGAQASTLHSCELYSESNPSVALTASTTLASGFNNFTVNSLVLGANTINVLALKCDVSANLVSGGTYTVNTNTGSVVAIGATTGTPATVYVRGTTPPVVPPVIPGIPSTGAGGEFTQTLAMLAASVLLASLGFSYLSLRKKQS